MGYQMKSILYILDAKEFFFFYFLLFFVLSCLVKTLPSSQYNLVQCIIK